MALSLTAALNDGVTTGLGAWLSATAEIKTVIAENDMANLVSNHVRECHEMRIALQPTLPQCRRTVLRSMRFPFEAVNGPLRCSPVVQRFTNSCSTASALLPNRTLCEGHCACTFVGGCVAVRSHAYRCLSIFKAVECVPSSTGYTNMLSTLTDVCSGPVDRSQVATAARRATTAARTARACRASAARPRYDGTPHATAATASAAAHARRCEACFGL